MLPLVGQLNPDVVLLDIRMPEIDGLACLDRIAQALPGGQGRRLLGLRRRRSTSRRRCARGACGYIVKSINPADLPSAIRQAVEGTVYHALGLPAATRQTRRRRRGLTERELVDPPGGRAGPSNHAIGQSSG